MCFMEKTLIRNTQGSDIIECVLCGLLRDGPSLSCEDTLRDSTEKTLLHLVIGDGGDVLGDRGGQQRRQGSVQLSPVPT